MVAEAAMATRKARRGKKDWRKNIDTSEVVTFLEEETTKSRQGPSIESLEDEQLFYIDKAPDELALSAAAHRKKRKAACAPLRSQMILASCGAAVPVPYPKRRRAHTTTSERVLNRSRQPIPGTTSSDQPKLDLWSDGPSASSADEWVEDPVLARQAGTWESKPQHKRAKVYAPITAVRAVEVDQSGCSFNPDAEQHQDALAALVAAEMKKVIKQDLAPQAPPAMVDQDGSQLDELDALLVDGEPEDDGEAVAQQHGEEGAEGEGPAGARRAAGQRKTKKDRNRELRRKAAEAELQQRRALKQQRREIDSLAALAREIEEAQEGQAVRQKRRKVVREERLRAGPPRLGRQRYESAPVQVLTSDELGAGSLRELRPCALLAKHRYKALEQRGLLEARRLGGGAAGKKQGRRVGYEKGARLEKAQEGQAELTELARLRKSLALAAKKAASTM